MQVIKSPFEKMPIMGPDNPRSQRPDITSTRWFLTGEVKTTKSHLLASIEDSFTFDIEDKFRHIDPSHIKGSHVVPKTLEELEGTVNWLVEQRGKLPFRMVCFDTVDEMLHSLVIPGMSDKVMGKSRKDFTDIRDYGSGKGGSKGWDMVNGYVIGFLRKLYLAGYGWVVTGHVKERNETKVIAINDGIKAGLFRAAEFIGTTSWKMKTVRIKKTITLPKGGTIDREEEVVQQVPILTINSKVGDSEIVTGSNVAFPNEVELIQGSAWSRIREVYETFERPKGV